MNDHFLVSSRVLFGDHSVNMLAVYRCALQSTKTTTMLTPWDKLFNYNILPLNESIDLQMCCCVFILRIEKKKTCLQELKSATRRLITNISFPVNVFLPTFLNVFVCLKSCRIYTFSYGTCHQQITFDFKTLLLWPIPFFDFFFPPAFRTILYSNRV